MISTWWVFKPATAAIAYLPRIKSMNCCHIRNNELDARSLKFDFADRVPGAIEEGEVWGRSQMIERQE